MVTLKKDITTVLLERQSSSISCFLMANCIWKIHKPGMEDLPSTPLHNRHIKDILSMTQEVIVMGFFPQYSCSSYQCVLLYFRQFLIKSSLGAGHSTNKKKVFNKPILQPSPRLQLSKLAATATIINYVKKYFFFLVLNLLTRSFVR